MSTEPLPTTKNEQPAPTQIRIEWLREQVATLTAQVGDLETTQARYNEAQAAAQAQLDDADPDTADWAQLAQVDVKAATYGKALRRIRADLAPARNKRDTMREHLAEEEGKVAMANAFVQKAHSIGLAAFPNLSVRDFQSNYARALGHLAAAGIVVERQDIAPGLPRWAGSRVAVSD